MLLRVIQQLALLSLNCHIDIWFLSKTLINAPKVRQIHLRTFAIQDQFKQVF